MMWMSVVVLLVYIVIFGGVGWLLWKLFSMLREIISTLQQILAALQRK